MRDAFRAAGHDAWSCDLIPTRGDPQWHYERDVLEVIGYGWEILERELADMSLANHVDRTNARDNIERIIDETRYPT